ncbi:MAG TPA: tetratricopeptide repeat protein [Kiritimatiellia bacterium]|nr:tetratricopeptide repeat protein [Kiritimatiellia bacterium]HRZ11667.1 tetratricopeptide repeat protein [Kiritimatiellia bacterium]HSA16782.1 tetratricopeptide repeat protein [Kiritimatiellia bacterium]
MRITLPRRLGALGLLLATGLAYSNALDGPFLMDDQLSIVENTAIRQWWPLAAALNPPPANVTFFTRPFVNLTMCVDYALGGLDPRGFHRTSLLLHLGATLALFGLARRTFEAAGRTEAEARRLGFASALLWSVHPLLTSAVNYLSQRSEVAMGLFLFLMLYGLNRAVREAAGGPATSRARFWFAVSALACLLGMGSKESMAAAPLLALAYDRIFLCASWRDLHRQRGLYYLALALTWLWPLGRHLAYSQYAPDLSVPVGDYWHYLLTQAWGLTRMLRLFLWPAPLIFYYGTQMVERASDVWPQLCLMAGLGLATAWALARHPRIGYLGLFFFAVLAPSSSFIPVAGQPIAEHRLYAPLAVLAVLSVVVLDRALRLLPARYARGGFIAVLLAWAATLGTAARERNEDYRDLLCLWRDTIDKRPQNGRAHTEYARVLRLLGRPEEGRAHLERVFANPPTEPGDLIHLGNALVSFGKLDEATRCFRLVLNSNPDLVLVWNSLGTTLVRLDRPDEAVAAFEEALRWSPTYTEPHYNLGNILFQRKQYDAALEHYRQAARGRPDVALNWFNLGVAHAQLEQWPDAERCVRRALELDPSLPNGRETLRRIRAAGPGGG